MRESEAMRKHRRSLTVIFSLLFFLSLLVSIAVIALVTTLLINAGVLSMGETGLDGNKILWLMAIFSVVLGTIAAVLVTRIPLKPINETISAINRLAAGDFHTRLHFGKIVSSIPAMAELNESFNKMAQELENTELLRTDFINNFSHEFKTPIMSIAGFSSLLKRGNLTEDQKQEYMDVIEKESLRLADMASGVLMLSNVENQTILRDVTKFNLSEQIRSAILLLENKWSRKNIEWNLDFDEVMITGNEKMLQQVWINLLDNAIKFTTEYGTVRVSIQQKEIATQVVIENTGSTISKDQSDLIFQKFYQADTSHATEGNGIGLAVVKKIVELHQGEIAVTSDRDVTAFTVKLPFSCGSDI